MQLRRLYLRYFPPALRLEYVLSDGQVRRKTLDLPHITAESNLTLLAQQLVDRERVLPASSLSKVRELLHRLVDKQLVHASHQRNNALQLHSVLRPHQQPLTNMACCKNAKLVATASYDQTIRLLRPFDSTPALASPSYSKHGEKSVTATLTGHTGVVFSLAFNSPHASRLLSGSFDKTCRLWDVQKRSCLGVYSGHQGEVVSAVFPPGGHANVFGSCSMDHSAIVWDLETEKPHLHLTDHSAEVSCLAFDAAEPTLVATGSCDTTVRLWDLRYGGCFRCMEQHDADLASVAFDYQANTLLTSSADGSCKLWDIRTGRCLFDWSERQQNEATHAAFSATGALVVAAGSDGNAFIYDTLTGNRRVKLSGHQGAVTKVCFSMQGLQVLTASVDGTARVWNAFSGECLQVLRGHEAEVFDCCFSYDGGVVLTASMDNSLRVWKREED